MENRPNRAKLVSLVPYGLNQQHPNHFVEMAKVAWDNRDQLGYALRILRNGCCDGCALGTTGMRDWTMKGIHLCNVRLALLRLNTMPALDYRLLENLETLQSHSEQELRKLGRLPYPMLRRRGDKGFRRITWEEAITTIAQRLRAVRPERIAWYVTSRGLTNEAYYAHQKVARFFGSNNVDTSARVCHAPSTSALNATVGVAATTCSYKDWIGTDLLVFIGSNPANNQPVAIKYLYYAKKAGTRVFLVNPYKEPGMERYWVPSVARSALFGTRIADDFFPVRHGGDTAFLYGVLKHLDENGWTDQKFISQRTAGWEELEEHLRKLSWDDLERASGLTRADMLRFAQAFANARHAIVVWSMGITQHRYGTDNVRSIVNLQLARGNVGRPYTGLMPIRGHSGVQGGAEMGCQPSAYGLGLPVNREMASTLFPVWGFDPPLQKGLNASEMLQAAECGAIDVLWQSGGNFLSTMPEPERIRHTLSRIKLRIHQDIVVTPSMLVESEEVILLPSRTRYEQRGGGTSTSTERRVIFSPEIVGPRPGEARDEWEIPVQVARAAHPEAAARAFPWHDTQDIRDEIDRVIPAYQGIARLRKKGDSFQYGGPRLLEGSFPTPDGKGHFSVVPLPREEIAPGQFLLSTRRGKQFNSMLFGDTDPLNGASRNDILMAAEDAARLGLHAGDRILLRNSTGRFEGTVKIDRIRQGCLQAHWPEVNSLIPAGRLDGSGVPDYNAVVELIPLTPRSQQIPATVGNH
jgi:molybdopterin-dependent oxidoreductase alpha subunit